MGQVVDGTGGRRSSVGEARVPGPRHRRRAAPRDPAHQGRPVRDPGGRAERLREPRAERQAREAGAFAYLDKGTMARRVHRVLLGAAVQAVLATNLGPLGRETGAG